MLPHSKQEWTTMALTHTHDCEAAENDCRFINPSETEAEAIKLAQKPTREFHGKDLTEDELRQDICRPSELI